MLFSDDFESGASKWSVLQGSWLIRDGKYGGVANSPSENAISIANVDLTTQNYSIELDMYPIRGIDRTIRFRRDSNAPGGEYDMHFTSDGIVGNFGQNSSYVLVNHPYEDNYSYHIKIILDGQRFKFLIDNQLIYDFVDTNYVFDGHESFSLVVATGTVPTEAYFDNIKIYTNDITDGLDVPLLKQTDPLWKDDVYDSANLWSSAGQKIADWGCALTSAAMIFQYNDLTKMEDNSDLDPGSLNSWLKDQPDGYVRNGLVNWLALSRLSKKISSHNNVDFDALEYSRRGVDNSFLTQSLQNNVPAILSEPGHFIVAKGVDDDNSSYFINDPYYNISSLSDAKYNNSYKNVGTYTQVNSDLSYMMFVVDESVDISLLDQDNNQVGELSTEDPIVDPSGVSSNSIGALKVLYVPKPESGNFRLNISSTNDDNYNLDQYYYDINGEVRKMSTDGHIKGGSTDAYIINFDKDNSNNSESHKLVTYDSIRQKIKEGYHDKKIKFGTQIVLLTELGIAEKSKKIKVKKTVLDLMVFMIKKDRKIDGGFAQELISDILALKNSL